MVRHSCFEQLMNRKTNPGHPPACIARSSTVPIPTSPRKFADVDWGSRKINRNKICAECWPGAAFGPY